MQNTWTPWSVQHVSELKPYTWPHVLVVQTCVCAGGCGMHQSGLRGMCQHLCWSCSIPAGVHAVRPYLVIWSCRHVDVATPMVCVCTAVPKGLTVGIHTWWHLAHPGICASVPFCLRVDG